MRRLLFLLPLAMALTGCDLATWSNHLVRARRATLAGDTATARVAWETALEAADRLESPGRRLQALRALANLAKDGGEPEVAAGHLERALVLVERVHGAQAPELLQVLPDLAARTQEAGDLGRSEAAHRRWVAVVEAHPPGVTGRRAPARAALARVLWDQGELPEAIQKYESVLSWIREEGGSRPEAVAVQLALSQLERTRGQVGEALELAIRAADRVPGGADPSPALQAAVAQAEAHALLRQPKVLPERVEAARVRARKVVAGTSEEARVRARDRRLAVKLAWVQGRLDAARELAEEGYGAALALDPPDPIEFRAAALTLAELVAHVGPLKRAEALYRRALEETARTRGARHPQCAEIRLALARIALVRGHLDEADDQLGRAEADLDLTWGTDITRRWILPLRARLELARGRGEAALTAIREASRRWRALGKKADPDAQAEVRVVLAAAHRIAGKPKEAGQFASQGYRLAKQRYGSDHPAPIETLAELARANHALGKRQRAQQALARALALAEAFLEPSHPWRQELPALANELGL